VTIKGLRVEMRDEDQHADSIERRIVRTARGTGVTRRGNWDEVIRLLHAHSIHPNAVVCPDTKDSLLTFAATEPAPEACEALLDMGADPRYGGKWSRTPLMHAIYARTGKWGSRDRKVVKLLASTINEQDSDGRTALMFAAVGAGVFSARRGNLGLLTQLLDLGAEVSIRNRWGRTALMEAIKDNDASPTSANADVVDLLRRYTLEREAQRLFEEHYQAVFSDTGELTLRPRVAPSAPVAPSAAQVAPQVIPQGAPQIAAPAKGWTRTRAAREDASVQTIARKMAQFFGLPDDSVALVDKKRKPLRGQDTIGTLWRKHSK
jgi:hypothetical protein